MPKNVLFHYNSYLNLNFSVLPRVTAQTLVYISLNIDKNIVNNRGEHSDNCTRLAKTILMICILLVFSLNHNLRVTFDDFLVFVLCSKLYLAEYEVFVSQEHGTSFNCI
jgi:hypothetical protein